MRLRDCKVGQRVRVKKVIDPSKRLVRDILGLVGKIIEHRNNEILVEFKEDIWDLCSHNNTGLFKPIELEAVNETADEEHIEEKRYSFKVGQTVRMKSEWTASPYSPSIIGKTGKVICVVHECHGCRIDVKFPFDVWTSTRSHAKGKDVVAFKESELEVVTVLDDVVDKLSVIRNLKLNILSLCDSLKAIESYYDFHILDTDKHIDDKKVLRLSNIVDELRTECSRLTEPQNVSPERVTDEDKNVFNAYLERERRNKNVRRTTETGRTANRK